MKTNTLQSESDYARGEEESRARNHKQQWTVSELEYIESNAGILTYQQIAINLGRTKSAVAQQASKLGVRVRLDMWSEEEDTEIYGMYPTGGTNAVQNKLKEMGFDRTPGAITSRARELKVNYIDTNKFEYLRALSQPDLFLKLNDIYKRSTGEKLTYRKLAEMCYVSYSRMQKWFAPGSGQEPLADYMKHHFFLACRLRNYKGDTDDGGDMQNDSPRSERRREANKKNTNQSAGGVTQNHGSKAQQRAIKGKSGTPRMSWTEDAVRMLGTMPDGDIAKYLGITVQSVQLARSRRGILAFKK
jgi:hypothetical protein